LGIEITRPHLPVAEPKLKTKMKVRVN
jgi:hypothetical protein